MKHYIKNLYDFTSKPNSIPLFIGQRENMHCPYCGKEVMIAVPTTGIDWELVANQYRNYANQMWEQCNILLSNAGVDTLLQEQMKKILEKCKKELE